MPATSVRDVHVSAPLSQLSVGYHPTGMVAEMVTALVPVVKENDKFYVWSAADAARLIRRTDGTGTLRADGSVSMTLDFGFTTDSYICEEYAANIGLTDRVLNNADDALQLQVSKLRRAQDIVLLDQEVRVAALYTTAANWATGHSATKTTTAQWDNASFTGSIEADIDVGREKIRTDTYGMVVPNQLVIPKPVALVAKRDAKIRDLVKYTHSDLIVDGDLPAKLWNLDVVIPYVGYNPTIEGETGTETDVWGKDVVIHYRNPNPGLDSVTSGVIFRQRPWTVFQWREDKVRTTFYEPSMVQTEKLVSNLVGYVIKTVIA